MGITIYQVDAFTDQPYKGSPTAVCLLNETRDDAWMQAVANEKNLSETAFLTLKTDYKGKQGCKVDGCKNKHVVKGYCLKHYMQIRRYGEIHSI